MSDGIDKRLPEPNVSAQTIYKPKPGSLISSVSTSSTSIPRLVAALQSLRPTALAVVLIGIGVLVVESQTFKEIVDKLGEIVTAVITGTFGLAAIVLTQHQARLSEEAAVHRHGLEENERRQREERQNNYANILRHIDVLIRKKDVSDELSKTHLATWVWGSPDVIRQTQALLAAKDDASRKECLERLVNAMRVDGGLDKVQDIHLEWVFPKPGGFDPPTNSG
jgi:hypothetical protein